MTALTRIALDRLRSHRRLACWNCSADDADLKVDWPSSLPAEATPPRSGRAGDRADAHASAAPCPPTASTSWWNRRPCRHRAARAARAGARHSLAWSPRSARSAARHRAEASSSRRRGRPHAGAAAVQAPSAPSTHWPRPASAASSQRALHRPQAAGAWKGTPAEQGPRPRRADRSETVIFEGNARRSGLAVPEERQRRGHRCRSRAWASTAHPVRLIRRPRHRRERAHTSKPRAPSAASS
jgi:hypothetical protein